MNDPIADMLTRIRNALAIRKDTIEVPYSKAKAALSQVLKDKGYLVGVSETKKPKRILELKLADEARPGRITEIHRLSKPGLRVYVSSDKIPTILRGRGMVIVSTSKGIMSGDKARKQGIGGELICKVW